MFGVDDEDKMCVYHRTSISLDVYDDLWETKIWIREEEVYIVSMVMKKYDRWLDVLAHLARYQND